MTAVEELDAAVDDKPPAAVEYERRLLKDWEPPASIKLGPAARDRWMESVRFFCQSGELTAFDLAVADVVASYSNNRLSNPVWPSQETIGNKIHKPSGETYERTYVNRSLAKYRRLGLLDWGHGFLPRHDGPRPLANRYHFTLPAEHLEKYRKRADAAARRTKAVNAERKRSLTETVSMPDDRVDLNLPGLQTMIAATCNAQHIATFAEAVDEIAGIQLSPEQRAYVDVELPRAWDDLAVRQLGKPPRPVPLE